MGKGISVADLERMMGKKADQVGDYVFDPDTGSFTRRITFKLSREGKYSKRRAAIAKAKAEGR